MDPTTLNHLLTSQRETLNSKSNRLLDQDGQERRKLSNTKYDGRDTHQHMIHGNQRLKYMPQT
jgi:hypothetical protein